MKLTESKLRRIIREELNIQQGRTLPPENSLNGYINRYIADTMKHFAAQLKSAYDIEFEDALLGDRSFQTDFRVYNSRQDMMKEGMIMMMHRDDGVYINVRGGQIGTPHTEQRQFIDKTIAFSEDPRQTIDIVSSFQILAGR